MKRVKVIKAKTLKNTIRKSALKTTIKKARTSIANNEASVAESYKSAIKAIDKAAAKNLIHKNTAARKKSQLTRALNAVGK